MLRNRKALCTTALIVLLFSVCWMPYCLFAALVQLLRALHLVRLNDQLLTVHSVLYLLIYANCCLDPFIYALRMREVQRGCVRLLLHTCLLHKENV